MAGKSRVVINFNHIPTLRQMTHSQTDAAVRELALSGQNHVKDLMRGSPASGKSYRRGKGTKSSKGKKGSKGGRKHVSSAPGEPPRIDTGALINSLAVIKEGDLSRTIVAGVEYAFWLEFGNTRGLAPRPFFGPMAFWLEGQIDAVFKKHVGKV